MLNDEETAIVRAAQTVLKNHVRDVGITANDPKTAVLLARNEIALAGAEREHFLVLFLNARHKLIKAEILFSGTLDGAEVHPRVVAQKALGCNAAAVILAHNHPSGDTNPSVADQALTQRLKQALTLLDIRLLDHFILTNNTHLSFAEKGWL